MRIAAEDKIVMQNVVVLFAKTKIQDDSRTRRFELSLRHELVGDFLEGVRVSFWKLFDYNFEPKPYRITKMIEVLIAKGFKGPIGKPNDGSSAASKSQFFLRFLKDKNLI